MQNTKRKELKIIKKKVKEFLQIIINDGFPVETAYLFGSYSRGDFKRDSDIDLLIISKQFEKNWDENEKYLWRTTRYVDSRLEPIGCSPREFNNSAILKEIIKKEGEKIF
jgi:predicted nucleotidyltransferase